MKTFIAIVDIPGHIGGYNGELHEGGTQLYLLSRAESVGVNIVSFCSDGIIIEPVVDSLEFNVSNDEFGDKD